MKTTLKKTTCMDCGCAILVAEYAPHPDYEYCTGHPAYRWDDTKMEDYLVGDLCDSCMNKRYENGATLSGPEWEVHL